MGLSFLLERLKASSKDFHPLCVTDFPETENVCPPQENSALTVSYRCFSPVFDVKQFGITLPHLDTLRNKIQKQVPDDYFVTVGGTKNISTRVLKDDYLSRLPEVVNEINAQLLPFHQKLSFPKNHHYLYTFHNMNLYHLQ